MAYGDNTLNADHQWTLDNTLNDNIGTLNLTATGTAFTAVQLTRDSTQGLLTNGRDDLATVAPDATSGSVALERYAFAGWFRTTQIQGPPCCIYKQGGTNGFALFLWAGNNVMLQAKLNGGNTIIQIFSDIALTDQRTYHFAVKFSGTNYDDEVSFYIDGVKQTLNKDGVAPGQTTMDAHTGVISFGENGTEGVDVQVGSESVLVKAPVNGVWSQWWTWSGADAQALTDNDFRENVFAPGAVPEITISADTGANMQIALDAIASTIRGDFPLCILVEEVTGGGDLSLDADNITFNSRASIHVRYEGTGTLSWTNINGSNASLGSGNVTFLNPSQLTLTGLDNPTEVRVYEAGTTNEVAGQESVTTGTFVSTVSVTPVDIRILSLDKENLKLSNIDLSSDLSIDVQQFDDRQYENP